VSTARPIADTGADATFSLVSVKSESFIPARIFGMPIFVETLPLGRRRT
jgi:hypothetical protein